MTLVENKQVWLIKSFRDLIMLAASAGEMPLGEIVDENDKGE